LIRAVVDTNVLISGLLTGRGYPAQVIEALLQNEFKAVVSNTLLHELREVSARPRFSGYPSFQRRVDTLINYLHLEGEAYQGLVQENVVAEDPDDDFVLACATEGKADYIVTGDHHLLQLGQFRGVQIITPREFFTLLERQSRA